MAAQARTIAPDGRTRNCSLLLRNFFHVSEQHVALKRSFSKYQICTSSDRGGRGVLSSILASCPALGSNLDLPRSDIAFKEVCLGAAASISFLIVAITFRYIVWYASSDVYKV